MDNKKTPEQLLQELRSEEEKKKRGRLKIFFGFAAGVGKTYSMLEAAHAAKEKGIDVVAGYIEPHARPQTTALLEGLERLPSLEVQYNGITLKEFDLDRALRRKPELILVDELAHTNAKGCRHAKRYQDVQELLNHGINVYTTINVQHIESLNDIVASMTGVTVRERIPDSVFDGADQVELIDIEPQDLLDRLNSGHVYKETQAQRALVNFFTEDNLASLREIALRRCADRVNLLTEQSRRKKRGGLRADEHILVCLSSAPSNAAIIRTAARMASAFRAAFTALFVETPDFAAMGEENRKRLRDNIQLAQKLGAKIETVYGDDVPLQIAEFARLSGISKIVIGRSAANRRGFLRKPSLTDRLIEEVPQMDIHIIPDAARANQPYRRKKVTQHTRHQLTEKDTVKSLCILIAASVVGVLFDLMGFTEANIITVYIFSVLLIAAATEHKIYSLASSIISVLVFNFLFTEPRYSLRAYDTGYPVTFLIMFLAALLTSSLATRLKGVAKQSANAAYKTQILFDTNQLLQQETNREAIADITAEQLTQLLDRDLVIYLENDGELLEPRSYSPNGKKSNMQICPNEQAVAAWVFQNNKRAGATTDTLSNVRYLYLAIRVNDTVFGVIGIAIDRRPLDSFEHSMLLSIIGECALALENEKNAKKREEAAILAKNEQFRANLLRTISHDLRTPLTVISGNASNLRINGRKYSVECREQIYDDIYEDAQWLINLVENLLAFSRLEDNGMMLNTSSEMAADIVTEALKHIHRSRVEHTITVSHEDELILVRADARLIVHVLINIIDNAIKYTPDGSTIHIETKKQGKFLRFSIIDNGPGIPDEIKPHIFDMFFTGSEKVVDSRRSLGLGLSLCKSIVSAHGGIIDVEDNEPTGSVFTFTLPVQEVELNGETIDIDC